MPVREEQFDGLDLGRRGMLLPLVADGPVVQAAARQEGSCVTLPHSCSAGLWE